MCVIIAKPKNVLISDKQIKNACEKNEDGFGFAIVENGRLKILKEYNPAGTEYEKVLAIMREHDDKDMMVHLRIKTIGDKNLDNCHPFKVMSIDDGDPWDIYFSHNGTLSEYEKKESEASDSRVLAEDYWTPLFRLFCKAEPGKNPLGNELLQHIIEKICGSGSRFCFLDNEGNSFIANHSGGKIFGEIDPETGEDKTWWASNSFSFDDPYKYTPVYEPYKHSHWRGSREENFTTTTYLSSDRQKDKRLFGSNGKDITPHHIVPHLPENWWSTDNLFEELIGYKKCAMFKTFLITTEPNEMSSSLKMVLASATKSYTELTGMKSLDELKSLEWDDLLHHCSQFPELTAFAILQLLSERPDDQSSESLRLVTPSADTGAAARLSAALKLDKAA